MNLQTKNYQPVDTSIWLDFDFDEVMGNTKLILPQNTKLPPFVHAAVLAVGPECKQVRKGDTILLNASTIMRMKVGQESEVFFTKENMVVAIVGSVDLMRNGRSGEKVIEFTGAKA